MTSRSFSLDAIVDCLKSTAEPSRLRILKMLSESDLTVSDLTAILGQSQPRVSRHLKLLSEAGLIRRWQEGSWALFRINGTTAAGRLAMEILQHADGNDHTFARDAERLAEVKEARRQRASDYFSKNAEQWDSIRNLHVADEEVEAALLKVTGKGPFNAVLDIGTGTGRMLEIYGPLSRSGVGIDSNRDMLNVARSNLDEASINHVEVRQGDVYNLPVGRDQFDLIIVHQVLHFLDDAQAAIREAARSLAPSGRLVVVDFATHDEESLREQHQHQRLGFDTPSMTEWFESAGLEVSDPVTVNAAGRAATNEKLTVMIWSACDQRYEVAAADSFEPLSKETV